MNDLRRYEVKWHVSQPYLPNKNPEEADIWETKNKVFRQVAKKVIIGRLWDFVVAYLCETHNVIFSRSRYSWGRNPLEIITGETTNIFKYLDFGIYKRVMFWKKSGDGPPELGRCLGVSYWVVPHLSYWILTPARQVVLCATVQLLANLE